MQYTLLGFGALCIIFGFAQQSRKVAEWIIRWSGAIGGLKTEITKQSIIARRVTGAFCILIGTGVIIFVLSNWDRIR